MEPSLPAEAASVPNPIGTKSSEAKPPKLALIPLRSAPIKINRQQKPLEAKQFPIVLGRTNLSQWWYESCDCQQYYCRLHCRPVAKNIGSLSKVMIQIDTQGKAHIVGKNPHLVTITSPERNDTKKTTTETATETKEDQQTPVMLRKGDILIIGRRDREPWMRFQVVENGAVASPHFKRKSANATISNERLVKSETSSLQPPILAPQQQESKPQQEQAPKNNARHDARLPEWITTTITNNSSSNNNNNNDSKNTRNYHYAENPTNNTTATDTKEQQRHQAMVATLTRAAAAAGAAADAEHNKNSKSNNNNKPYRYNSYYNYYNGSGSNYEPTADPIQRKRRRTTLYPQMTTSNVSTNTNNNNNSKSVIRSAEDLFHNGSSRRAGGRLHHNNDPQIHLVFQDYETSAQLIRAGTKKARNPQRKRKRVRTDRDFIGKATDELQQQQQQQQQPQTMGLMLSQNYAAALLNVGTPALAKSIPEDT